MKNLDEILHKSVTLSKMNTNDPMFGDRLFDLTNLMRAKGNVGIISDIISEAIKIHRQDHCQNHSKKSPSLGFDPPHDDVEHGYYDEDDDSDFDLDDAMRHFGLMANLRGYESGGKEWVLDSGCTDHMTGDEEMFRELAENDGPRKSLLVITQKVRWLASVRWPSYMIAPYKMSCSLNLLDTTYFQYLDLLISV